MKENIQKQDKKIVKLKAKNERHLNQIQIKNGEIRELKDEIKQIRNDTGLGQLAYSMNQMTDAAEQLDHLSKEKWRGLQAMDEFLQ